MSLRFTLEHEDFVIEIAMRSDFSTTRLSKDETAIIGLIGHLVAEKLHLRIDENMQDTVTKRKNVMPEQSR